MKRMMRFFLPSFALVMCLISPISNADVANVYQIELIVFSHMSKKALDIEQWPLTITVPSDYPDAIQLAPPDSAQKYLKQLSPKDFTLNKEENRLNKFASTYHIITHIAWRQQIFEPRYAKAVHISGGEINTRGTSTPQLNGTIKLSVQRYLNVRFNLFFAAPTDAISRLAHNDYFDQANGEILYFHLKQTRRMRSSELNYVDFPLYGILIKITPVGTKA